MVGFGPPGSENSNVTSTQRVVSHFFVSSYPFFESSVFLSLPQVQQDSDRAVKLFVYDCSGSLVNELGIDFGLQSCGIVELDPLMEACKLESGFKHAHLEVEASPGTKVVSRIYSRNSACLMSAALNLSDRNSTFFPVLFSEERAPFLGLINSSAKEAQIRCRLYFGKRSPEIQYSVPARGSRLVSLLAEFSEYGIEQPQRSLHAYVRVSTSSNINCGVQLIESIKGEKGAYSFSGVS